MKRKIFPLCTALTMILSFAGCDSSSEKIQRIDNIIHYKEVQTIDAGTTDFKYTGKLPTDGKK